MSQNGRLVKRIQVGSKKDYFVQHLKILNAILPVQLTGTQIEVLSEFMCEPEEYRFSTAARKKISRKLGLSRAGMSNYLKQLADKGFLVKEEVDDKLAYTINKLILPLSVEQEYEFILSGDVD